MSNLTPHPPADQGKPPLQQTLVNYDPPVHLSELPAEYKYDPVKANTKREMQQQAASQLASTTTAGGASSPTKKEREVADAREVLNDLFPPVQWEENAEKWIQFVADAPTSRMDVINLQEQLDQHCQNRNALMNGICPVREDLYAQCFDELIRQVTVSCAERGVLLSACRDELGSTIDAYRAMFDTSAQLSMRQALQLEKGKSLVSQLQEIEGEAAMLERQVAELQAKHASIEKREVERRQTEEQKHKEEVTFLKKANLQLTNEIKRYMS
eukprot:TRINITY_DN68013_c8_g6_i1.p1 TRINITY_DN68013_c8_g6~~TRINITY_DN68013_c8_g6_i1.p1  ORF type:complete len:270 (+),score=33.23 TRINITY_DN68013_c8_g6_i1:37-846(+)